jgi:hypothetical protein
VTVWVPRLLGGEYRPALVIVPEDVDPFTTPSTDQITPVRLEANCCVRVGVNAATRGLINSVLEATPVPDSAMVWGLPAALSAMVIVALPVPVAPGVNVTLIVQLLPGARDDAQLLVSTNSLLCGPEIVILLIESPALPVFVTITVCAPLVVPTV